jgi:hypothetical protein
MLACNIYRETFTYHILSPGPSTTDIVNKDCVLISILHLSVAVFWMLRKEYA